MVTLPSETKNSLCIYVCYHLLSIRSKRKYDTRFIHLYACKSQRQCVEQKKKQHCDVTDFKAA